MTDPNSPRRVSATIKFPESKRYANDNPWLVFEGASVEDVRQMVGEAAGMTEDDLDGLRIIDVVSNVQAEASAMGNVKSELGGISTGTDKGKSEGKPKSEPKSEAKSDEPDNKWLYEKVEQAQSRKALKDLWGKHKANFEADSELFNAWKQRGKSLPKD